MLLVSKIRKERGFSQAKLARLSEVNQSSLNRIEAGKEPPFPKRGQRIADALGWTGDYAELFEEVSEDE